MKIAKALKLKNRLAGEIAKLKEIVQARNVIEAGQEVVYDVKKMVDETMPSAITNLVTVKTAIAVANSGSFVNLASITADSLKASPYWAIFMIAEFKGMIETLKAINTKNGKFTDFRGLRDAATQVEYVAQVKQQEIDRIVSGLEAEIDAMQDELDAYNATTDVAAINGILVK